MDYVNKVDPEDRIFIIKFGMAIKNEKGIIR